MGTSVHTVVSAWNALGRLTSSGSLCSIKCLASTRLALPALNIPTLGLGFSQCFWSSGILNSIGRLGRPCKKAPFPSRCRLLKIRARVPPQDGLDTDDELPEGSQPSLNDTVFSAVDNPEGDFGGHQQKPVVPYRLIVGLASVGFVETAYLTWAKLGGLAVTCPIGGSCSDVLDSSYATVFGVPLALIGMAAYGAIGLLGGILMSSSSLNWEEEEEVWGRWLMLACTTTVFAASTYFMYILTTKLEGASCAYCVGSAILSLSLLLSALRGFTLKDIRTIAGLQLAVGSTVVLGLSVAFGDANSAFARSQDLDLPPVEPEVLTVSSPREILLAKHLQSVGARMFGAFWCSHCYEQKQMFGREAMKYVNYVECYPEGYRKGIPIAKDCDVANIQGFPTWIIKGQTLSGEQELEDLAKASGFDTSKLQ